jgi:hypothetical protein
MKNKNLKKAIVILIMALLFLACKGKAEAQTGGGRSVNSAEALKEYLDSQPANSPDKPIKVAMKVNELMIGSIGAVITGAGKYVSLDLSGSPLTAIPDRAFRGCTGLVGIIIPDGITSIGNYAFARCTSLASVVIPDSVAVISGGMFQGCAGLASLPLPKSTAAAGSGGGKIFYYSKAGFTMTDNGQVCHYLEAAPDNMTTSLKWASSGYYETNITGTRDVIGTGRKNTALILAVDANAPAAKACKEYSNNGKTDWFLPSNDELNQLYVSKDYVGNMGSNYYWSSSQYSSYANNAWEQSFSNGYQYDYVKDYPFDVRAVRAF